MTEEKFLTQLAAFFKHGNKRRRRKTNELHDIVKKLRKLEKRMVARCHETSKGSKKRETLERRYRVLHAQRIKGQKALKKLEDR